jgi:hypothetical protein
MRKFLLLFPDKFFAASIFLFAGLSLFSCRKDDFSGWTQVYLKDPPGLRITKSGILIKNCEAPFPVSFYQEVENLRGAVSYFWDFGDGSTSTEKIPNHIYDSAGTYKVTFIVKNEISSDTAILNVTDMATGSVPVSPDFTFLHTNSNNYAPTQLSFQNVSSGANQFKWFFGNGDESNNDSPVYVFQNPGNYNVTLRGTCTNGTFKEISKQILVMPAPQRIVVDSLTLMLPSNFKNDRIFLDFYKNSILVGGTVGISASSFPLKLRKFRDFMGSYIFDNVQFTNNETLIFKAYRDLGPDVPPVLIAEFFLATSAIQSKFYPRIYYQIETVPRQTDMFVDLYLNY